MRYALFILILFGLQSLSVSSGFGGATSMTNKLGMQFVYIEPGSFLMGSPSDEAGRDDDEQLHKVNLTKGFYMETTEVTQEQYLKLMKTNPSGFKDCGRTCPVEQVSWDDCQAFIEKLNQYEGTDKYRLPTEAEWEYACRAGSTKPFAYVDLLKVACDQVPRNDQVPWYWCNASTGTKPVALKRANQWGLYDMYGNVQEWCLDSCDWQSMWTRRTGAITGTYRNGISDPLSSKGNLRIVRGGSWNQGARYARAANRSFFRPKEHRRSYIGFRILKEE